MTHTQASQPAKTKALSIPAAFAAIFTATIAASIMPASADVSYTAKMLEVPHRDAPVKLDIYYPVEPDGEVTMHGKNAVFTGIELSTGADPLSGKFPVVIFSHGSGGNGINTGWILKALADEGMVVIAPNHPGTTSRDSHPEDTVKTWERPQDVSSIIDQLAEILPNGMSADMDNIGTVGFSLGGYSVLSLAGAKVSKQAFIDHCDRSMDVGLNECGWLTKDGLDLNDTDQVRFEQSNFEPRIKATVSVDPGLAAAFTTDSLKAMDRPVKIINLGSQGKVYAGVDGQPVAKEIPGAEFHRVNNSSHFSFLGVCTAIGPEILKAEKDDPICDEHGGRDRGDIHAEITSETVKFLKHHLTPIN